MAKYRKSEIVEALQWDGYADTANRFLGERYGFDWGFITYSYSYSAVGFARLCRNSCR